MSVPEAPPLNGRRIAEFYTASEVAKRSVLRAYALPAEEQEARIILYDPVRKILPEYFDSGRDTAILDRVGAQLGERSFRTREFTEKWYKSNSSALRALQDLDLAGELIEVDSSRASVKVGRLRLVSTVDFYATFVPRLGKRRRVGVIIHPSGVAKPPEARRTWINVESEVAWRAAVAQGIEIDEIMYIDLPKQEIRRYKGPRVRIWDEIGATCERIINVTRS